MFIRLFADIAQEVERSIGSAEVTGPTPVISFNKSPVSKRLTRLFLLSEYCTKYHCLLF